MLETHQDLAEPIFRVRRLSIAEILDEGFVLFRHCFPRLLLLQLIVYVPNVLLTSYGIVSAGELLIELVELKEDDVLPALGTFTIKIALYAVAAVAVQVLVGAIVMVATSKAVADSYVGQVWTTGSALRTALRLGPRAVGVGVFLFAIFLTALGVPVAVIAAGAAAALSAGTGGAGLLVLTLVAGAGLLFAAIVLVLLLVLRYGLALVVLGVENLSALQAIRRSVALMKGRYLRGLGLFGILIAVNLLIASIITAFVPFPNFEGVDPDELRRMLPQLIRGQVLSTVLSQVSGVFVHIYTSICWVLFYFTARCEAEAFDLEHLARPLGGKK